MKNTLKAIILMIAGLSNQVHSQEIFKKILPDGTVVYTDNPSGKGKTEKKIKMESSPQRQQVKPTITDSNLDFTTSYKPVDPATVLKKYNLPEPGTPVVVPNLPPLPGSSVSGAPMAPEAPKTNNESEKQKQKQKQDKATISAAEENLAKAKDDAAKSIEPQAGERSRNANGTMRLNEVYKTRQEKLSSDIQRAQSQLDEARKK